MSFYGNIKRVQSSPYVFDKYYPNRKAMEDACATDDVYIGRYVLVKYTTDGEGTYFDRFVIDENSATQKVYTGYKSNADIDIENYGDTFDATIWQKIYTNVNNNNPEASVEKYIMVAELNAAVPRLELDIISPKNINGLVETWNAPRISTEASSEDSYLISMPDMLHLDVGNINSDFYAKSLVDNPGFRSVIQEDGVTLTHEQMLSSDYNYMKWVNETATRDSQGNIDDSTWHNQTGNGPIDGKKLDTKLYAFGQLISDLYDALYGIPTGGTGPRPFYTSDLSNVLANYDKGLIGILTSIATDMKGDASVDLYGRSLQPGLYYYFTSKWCDASENPDSFIENIPRVIGSTNELSQGKCHYKIDFINETLVDR